MAGAYIFGCSGPRLTPSESAFFRDSDPWGFILFARNIGTPEDVTALTASLREAVGRDAPILIDQEGGRVQRMGPPFWDQFPPPLEQMQAATDPIRAMELRARLIAADLHTVGIDVNCTPTADIASDATHPFLRNRLYGSDRDSVIDLARANASGTLAGGVLPVVKHIPGHGRATVDSHHDLPRVETPAETLRAQDFAVFAALNDLPLGMSAHVVYADLDPDAPGTTSPVILAEIRETIGFDGLLMTDDLSMGALPGSIADRTSGAIGAGIDVILHCNGHRRDMEDVAATAPRLTGKAAARADAALALRQPPVPLDMEAAREELRALTA